MALLGLALLLASPGPLAGVASAQTPGRERWALLVGVDRFQGNTRPNYGAVNDVRETREALIRAGWASENIKVLTDGGARADDIRSGLRWLVERSSADSFNVFHYSGHVKQASGSEFLWPHDNRFIRDTELAGELRQLRGTSWVNVSGCEANGFDEGVSAPNRLFTASSGVTEKSYEMVEAGNSVFTMLMVEQGMLGRQAEANGDGKVSIQEAFRYAAARAPDITRRASNGPQHPVMAGGDGSELFLELPPVAVPLPRTCGINLLGLCLF